MSELLDFAAQLIELEGGAVELSRDRLDAILPEGLACRWQVPDELALSEGEGAARRLAYGSELLEHMLDSATSSVSLAATRLDLPVLRGSQVKAAAERWSLRNGLVSITDVQLLPSTRLQLFALATLRGDEKRELLVSSVLSAWSGTELPVPAEQVAVLSDTGRHEAVAPAPALLEAGMRACTKRAVAQAQAFRNGMTRRYERDRQRIEAYFDDLLHELDRRASRGKLEPSAVADKRNALLANRAAKLEALTARFVLRVEVMPIGLRAIEVDGGFANVKLRRRKATRELRLEYDPASREIVPPRCDGCGGGAARPAACDDALHLLCESCAPRADGRIACVACNPARASSTAR